MKIAIYTIMRDESKHCERYMKGAEDADEVIILDTGSTDDSVMRMRQLGASVHEAIIQPWRFDVARNKCLDLVPDDVDVCLSVDLDEIPSKGWRDIVEKKWVHGINRGTYWHKMITSDDIGDPAQGERYYHSKLHSRHGYFWVKPVHEEVRAKGPESVSFFDFYILHKQDLSKSRSFYLDLLLQTVKEDPLDTIAYHVIIVDYFKLGDYVKSLRYCQHVVDNLRAHDLYAAHICHIAAQCCMKLYGDDSEEVMKWQERAVLECPWYREPWFQLAKICYNRKDFVRASRFANNALKLQERHWTATSDHAAWDGNLELIAAISANMIGEKKEADKIFTTALRVHPKSVTLAKEYATFLADRRS